MSDPGRKPTLEQYAALLVRLPDEPAERARLLAEHGLDETGWDELDRDYQEQLDAALDGDGAGTGVPELVTRFSAALDSTPPDAGPAALDLDRYAAITRGLRQGRTPQKLLEAEGLPMRTYLDAHLYWAPRVARDRALAERFQRILDGKTG